MSAPLLEVRDLTIRFGAGTRNAVDGVSFHVAAGETVAIVGESGSGKSTTAHAVLGLLPSSARRLAGSVRLSGAEVSDLDEAALDRVRGRQVGFVPQDPLTNLNPVRRVGGQVAEGIIAHGLMPRARARARAVELFAEVGLRDPQHVADSYPHQLSGGMRQRVLIAMALACGPQLLIADEPTSALDVTVQRQILDLLRDTAVQRGIATLVVTHDLALAAERADRILVMRRGQLVESGPAEQVYYAPRHEYTQRLFEAAPRFDSPRLVDDEVVEDPGPRHRDEVLETRDLAVSFGSRGVLGRRRRTTYAVKDVSVVLRRGRTLGVVGESGSGKTTLARTVLRLQQPDSGDVLFEGKELGDLRGARLRAYRRRVQPVFQDPYSSLDGAHTIERIVAEPMELAGGRTAAERRARVLELLAAVALEPEIAARRPSQLSGGQRQRVAIARALAADPEILVCDESVSALDVVVQQQILELLARLQRELGLSIVFISHDLAVIRLIAHHVAVMHRGEVVELGPTEQVFTQPRTEYTRTLLGAIPDPTVRLEAALETGRNAS